MAGLGDQLGDAELLGEGDAADGRIRSEGTDEFAQLRQRTCRRLLMFTHPLA